MLMTSFSSKFFSVVFSIATSFAPVLTTSAWAETIEPPPGSGSPSGTIGGASRPIQASCFPTQRAAQKSLIALTPGKKVGLTSSARPKFTIHLPETLAKAIEISVFDAQMRGIYQTTVATPKQSGLVTLTLPDTAPELESGKAYYWTIALVCNEQDRTEDWVVGGWIQRSQLTPQLSKQLSGTSELEQATIYAQAGFWYDALAMLTEANSSDRSPSTIATAWNNLLKSVGLETLVTVNTLH